MAEKLDFGPNPWSAYGHERGRAYIISQISEPDPRALEVDPVPLKTSYPVDYLIGAMGERLGIYDTLEAAQAAAQADAQIENPP